MALINANSRCAICGERVASEPRRGFPHFTGNRADPLHRFTDSVVHVSCLERSPLRDRLADRLRRFDVVRRSSAVCPTCQQPASPPVIRIPILVDDASHPIFRFNGLAFHPEHLARWDSFPDLLKHLDAFVADGHYVGRPLIPESARHSARQA